MELKVVLLAFELISVRYFEIQMVNSGVNLKVRSKKLTLGKHLKMKYKIYLRHKIKTIRIFDITAEPFPPKKTSCSSSTALVFSPAFPHSSFFSFLGKGLDCDVESNESALEKKRQKEKKIIHIFYLNLFV